MPTGNKVLSKPNPGPNYPSNELINCGTNSHLVEYLTIPGVSLCRSRSCLCVDVRFKKKPRPTLAIEIQVTIANVGVYKRGYKDLSDIHSYVHDLCSILYTCRDCVTSSTNWVHAMPGCFAGQNSGSTSQGSCCRFYSVQWVLGMLAMFAKRLEYVDSSLSTCTCM